MLGRLKDQIKESYASAPQEFVEAARRNDFFNEALPPLTASEIAAEVAKLAESAGSVVERALATPDLESLKPNRKRGPRPTGFKINLNKKSEEGGGAGGAEE